ncbi:14636_t:CDS:2, partial [Dentiscutata erythropus]
FEDIRSLVDKYIMNITDRKELIKNMEYLQQYLRKDYVKTLEVTKQEKKKLGTLLGISTWHKFTWPETDNNARYICARSLPKFGPLHKFSPLQLQKIIKDYVFEKPTPSSTAHTQPAKTWTTFHNSIQDEGEEELINQEEDGVNSDKDLGLINSENTTDMDIDAPSR